MQRAHDVFVALEDELGRPVTYEEVLAFLAYHEFGKLLRNDDEYNTALEAEGRQFYTFCGSDGLCQGDELWKFLGGHDAWTLANPVGIADELRNGILEDRDFAGAQRILNQPYYDPSKATEEQKKSNWRSADTVGGVPYVYGNYSLYAGVFSREKFIAKGVGFNSNALDTILLNLPDANGVGVNGYVVMTIGQKRCILGKGPCQ